MCFFSINRFEKIRKLKMDQPLSSKFELDLAAKFENQKLNIDPNPILINRKPIETLTQIQNVKLQFLKPPPLEPPGDITIIQEPDKYAPDQAPLHVRANEPVEPTEPAPLVVREKPPKPPAVLPDKVVVIPGKIIQKPRKIIIEHVFREVRYENVPPQLTRDEIKKYIKEKLKREKSSGQSGDSASVSNLVLSTSDASNSAQVSNESESFTQLSKPITHTSAQFSNNNNVSEYFDTTSNVSFTNSQGNSNRSQTLTRANNVSVSMRQPSPMRMRMRTPSPAPLPLPPPPPPMFTSTTYYPGYEPPPPSFHSHLSRQNRFYQTLQPDSRVGLINFANNYSTLSASFVPNQIQSREGDLTEMNMYEESLGRFRRIESLRPHREVSNNLRLLGFNV